MSNTVFRGETPLGCSRNRDTFKPAQGMGLVEGLHADFDKAAHMEVKSGCQTSLAWTGLELSGGSGFEAGGSKS